MDLTEGSETSEKLNLTPGKYPKENIQDSKHGEYFKSRKLGINIFFILIQLDVQYFFSFCSQTNTKHINTVWAERTVIKMLNLFEHPLTGRFFKG
jgi:hypothetical protein